MAFMVRTYGSAPYRIAAVHGGPGALGDLGDLAYELQTKTGYSVLEPIQTRTAIRELLDELKTQLSENCEFPVILIGHSWGAWLSAIFTAAHPELVKKIILVGCPPLSPEYAEDIVKNRIKNMPEKIRADYYRLCGQLDSKTAGDKDGLLRQLSKITDDADYYCREKPVREFFIRADGTAYEAVWREAAEVRKNGKLLDDFRSAAKKIILIHGKNDPHPAEGVLVPLNDRIRRIYLLERCGHTPWREKYAKNPFIGILKDNLIQQLAPPFAGNSSYMRMPDMIEPAMLAPCGVNCMVCYKHCRSKIPCEGCLNGDTGKPGHCRTCEIKDCVREKGIVYCHDCREYPCRRIKYLEKSYNIRYGASPVRNGKTAKEQGIPELMRQQKRKYTCPVCGGIIPIQDSECRKCRDGQ